jgi:uncharacterized protein YegP (UPF0339 family)
MWQNKVDGRWNWRLNGPDGLVIAHGQGYPTKQECAAATNDVHRFLRDWEHVELREIPDPA